MQACPPMTKPCSLSYYKKTTPMLLWLETELMIAELSKEPRLGYPFLILRHRLQLLSQAEDKIYNAFPFFLEREEVHLQCRFRPLSLLNFNLSSNSSQLLFCISLELTWVTMSISISICLSSYLSLFSCLGQSRMITWLSIPLMSLFSLLHFCSPFALLCSFKLLFKW